MQAAKELFDDWQLKVEEGGKDGSEWVVGSPLLQIQFTRDAVLASEGAQLPEALAKGINYS